MRKWLYLGSYDVGQIFEGEEDIARAKAEGWEEHPGASPKPERVEHTGETQPEPVTEEPAEPVKRRRGRPPKVRTE